MQREEHGLEFQTLLQHDEALMTRNEIISDHMSFQPSDIPSTSHHGSDCAENSKPYLYVQDEFCVVYLCHKKNGHICQLLEEETLLEDIICEPHNLSGSLKEDINKHRESMKTFVDINALVARCCWKASSGEMEGESFLEECIEMKEGMAKMKETYVKLLYDIDHLLMVVQMYHNALKKEEEESDRLTHELGIINNSFKSTQKSLQELKLQTYQLQKYLRMSHLSCFMEGNFLGIMGKSHVDEGLEKRIDLQMLGKSYKEYNMDQEPIEIEEKDEVFFYVRKTADHFPYGSANKVTSSSINWVDIDTLGMKTM